MTRTRQAILVITSAVLLCALSCSSGPLRIGVVLPLTGSYASYGAEVKRGVDLAARDAEIGGRPVEIVVRDSGSVASRAAETARALVEQDGAYALIGGVTTDCLLALVPVAREEERILLSPTAAAGDEAFESEWVHSLWPAEALEAAKLATLARRQGVKYLTLGWAQGPYGQGFKNEFAEAFKRQRGEILLVQNFSPGLAEADAAELGARLASSNPDAVLVVTSHYADLAAVSRGLAGASYSGKVLATSAAVLPSSAAGAGGALDGILFAGPPFDADGTKASREFSDAYRKAFSAEPTVWAAYGYDSVGVLLAALRKNSSYPSDTQRALRRLTDYPGAAGSISFDTHGRVVRPLVGYTVRDGSVVPYAAAPAGEAGGGG